MYLVNDGKRIKELVAMLEIRHPAQAACVLEVLGEFGTKHNLERSQKNYRNL